MEKSNGNGKRRRIAVVFLSVVLVVAITAGYWYWRQAQLYVKTDDAKVAGDIVDISPKVAGRLDKLLVAEGDQVKAGQLLARLDDSQYRIALNQAQAALEQAKANLARLPDDQRSALAAVDRASQGVAAAQAQQKTAEIALNDAKRVLDENEMLYAAGAISKEAIESTRNAYAKAQAALDSARANTLSAQSGLADAQAKLDAFNNSSIQSAQAQLKQAQAAYDTARLNLDNTRIIAPVSGTVVRIPVQVGENLSIGQVLVTVSNLRDTWVAANIEEKKFGRIKVGQRVDVTIDAYPGVVFKGRVSELGGATQSTFSLIPTENTTGNYTKVTQYLPVKIRVEKRGYTLKPGMSAYVKIHVR